MDRIILGDCIDIMDTLPEKSVDVVFADPPYNLQLGGTKMHRPDRKHSRVEAVDDEWDKFESFLEYDEFSSQWLKSARRVMKDTATIWVIGSYHNIYRVGAILMDLGYWMLNDVVWIKSNPMPNFHGTRLCNAHETLLWAKKHRNEQYTFNYKTLKSLNGGKQMRSEWRIPICQGRERLLTKDGHKAHSTQKPEALLYRVILASTRPGDVVLDPFFGTGTTGAVAKRMRRHFIGIEKDAEYVELARTRIDSVQSEGCDPTVFDLLDTDKPPRVPFSTLLEHGFLAPGQTLYLNGKGIPATILSDGRVTSDGLTGSIHQVAKTLLNDARSNGWQVWHYEENGERFCLDVLRQQLRDGMGSE